jgi:hypothetical protein
LNFCIQSQLLNGRESVYFNNHLARNQRSIPVQRAGFPG